MAEAEVMDFGEGLVTWEAEVWNLTFLVDAYSGKCIICSAPLSSSVIRYQNKIEGVYERYGLFRV